MAGREWSVRPEEEHARIVLEAELGLGLRHYDDGSANNMPDLLSMEGRHVAEVITTVPGKAREARQHLTAVPVLDLPHCVRVAVPFTLLGMTGKKRWHEIQEEVVALTAADCCKEHWPPLAEHSLGPARASNPLLFLGALDGGVTAYCIQQCRHPADGRHRVEWSVVHRPSSVDPWQLLGQSLQKARKQHGGIQALAEKLSGYPHKHLVMYPFGPPENLTAEFSHYMPPSNVNDFLPPFLDPPLSDLHVWILYQYGNGDYEGRHLCGGQWARFGTSIPKVDGQLAALLQQLHYGNSPEGPGGGMS
ncbi:hypothetical protein [Paenarthrobacter sp. 2TAF44]|uniref:hypothetical protein n=1 Tax=Paenarthrobacter sp. 2TAF44 TaxID=3233018 RepID=UPI003F9D124D